MIITSLDLLLLAAVPVLVAVLGTILWRLAVRRLVRRASVSAAREKRPAPASRFPALVHTGGDAAPVSRYSEPAAR